MNDQSTPWAFWQNALAGQFGPIHENAPQTGFYRVQNDPVAIWELGGEMVATRAGRPVDAAEVWTWACRKPITHELFEAVTAGGAWPEQIDAEVAAAAPAGIGHNSGEPHEEILDELAAIERAFTDWLASIGGTITTEEHDAKADTFKDRFAALAKKADQIRDELKRPHLEAGRAIDGIWKPIEAKASDAKRKAAAIVTPYRRAREDARLKAEAEARAAAAKAAREAAEAAERAAQAGLPSPPPVGAPAPAEPPRPVKTGLRTVKVLVITDPLAAVTEILRIAPDHPDIIDAIRLVARRMLDAGTPVPGAEIRTERRA